MKKLYALVVATSILVAPDLFAVMTVRLDYPPSTLVAHGANGGGEFLATPSGWSVLAGAYSTSKGTISISGFETFCIEEGETFNPGATYNVVLNSGAVYGGGVGHHGIGGLNSDTFDAISIGTAWLYSQFAKGYLAGYDYTPASGGRYQDESALQIALWALENEGSWAYNSGNEFEKAVAVKYKGSGTEAQGFANAQADANGEYGVVVMNLSATDGRHQDQLAIVPEPTTLIAGVLLLLPFGVSTIRMLRRRHTA